MATCFVMQPFDGGAYDKRYNDEYAPAIVAAGHEPYRVDHDPSVSVPIESIEAARHPKCRGLPSRHQRRQPERLV